MPVQTRSQSRRSCLAATPTPPPPPPKLTLNTFVKTMRSCIAEYDATTKWDIKRELIVNIFKLLNKTLVDWKTDAEITTYINSSYETDLHSLFISMYVTSIRLQKQAEGVPLDAMNKPAFIKLLQNVRENVTPYIEQIVQKHTLQMIPILQNNNLYRSPFNPCDV